MTGRALPAVTFRDLIRSEISKMMREVDQISMGVVSDVDDLEVLLDGMTVAVPVAWAAAEVPVAGARVICVALRGGQQWIVTGSVNGGTGLAFLPLAGGEMSGDIELPNNIDLVFGDARATIRHTTDFTDRLVIDSLDAMWFHTDAGFAFFVGAANDPAYLRGEVIRYTATDTFDHDDYPGMRAVLVQMVGGGGAGGGAAATVANQGSFGNGGDGGDYAESLILVADLDTSEAVTVGAGGSGNSGAAGDPGTDSVFDTISGEVRAAGGLGGAIAAASTSNTHGSRTTPTGAGSVGDLVIPGGPGGAGWRIPSIIGEGGRGGNSRFGNGAAERANGQQGFAGNGYGAGGNGTCTLPSSSALTGGDGTDGIVIATVLY